MTPSEESENGQKPAWECRFSFCHVIHMIYGLGKKMYITSWKK